MNLQGIVALVTGASGGIGAEFINQLVQRGAAKVYVVSRSGNAPKLDGVIGLQLDVTEAAGVEALSSRLEDVELLLNNAGIGTDASLISRDMKDIRREFETNAFAGLSLARAFAAPLKGHGGGAILNVLSAASWFAAPGATTYAASKAAAWSFTDGLRVELASQGTHVMGLHMAVVDAGMGTELDGPKIPVSDVVSQALDGLEAGDTEVLADNLSRQLKSAMGANPTERYAGVI